MKTVSIDSVINAALIDLGLSIHWYMPLAHWTLRCLRELHFSTLKRGVQKRITLDEWGEYDLTQLKDSKGNYDFVGMIGLFGEVGGQLKQLPRSRNVNTTIKTDDNGDRIEFPPTDEYNGWNGGWPEVWGTWRFYSVATYRGELKGRQFGRGQFSEYGTWSFDWEREVIKVWPKEHFGGSTVVLKYVSWGEACQSSLLPVYAADVLLQYAVWKYKARSRIYSRFEVAEEKKDFGNALRILRARMKPLNKNDIRKASRRYGRPSLNY